MAVSRAKRSARNRAVFSRIARSSAWYSAITCWPSRNCCSFLNRASARRCTSSEFMVNHGTPLVRPNRRSLASRPESHLYKELIKEGLRPRLSFAGNVFKSSWVDLFVHSYDRVNSKASPNLPSSARRAVMVGRYGALLPLLGLVGVRCIAALRVKSLLRHRSDRPKRRLTPDQMALSPAAGCSLP